MSTNPPIVIPPINNQTTGSVQTLPDVTVYSTSKPKPLTSPDTTSSAGFNVASLITPSNLATLQSLKENPKAFGDQLKDQAKQKVIQAATQSTLARLLKEKADLIQKGIELDINHQLTLAKLELRHTPKKQYINGVTVDIPPELDDEEYKKAVAAENKNYTDEKDILQLRKNKNREDLDKYLKDPFKKIKDKKKELQEKRKKLKSRTKSEKTKARKEKIKAVLKNAKKTLGPILTLLITNKIAEIVAQNDRIQKLINETNAVITDANQSGDPLKLSNAKLARDNTIKIINNNQAKIQKVAETINKISVYINIFSLIVTIISSIPIPTAVPPGIGVPVNLIMKFVKILDKANRIFLMLSSLIPVVLGILQKTIAILEDLKSQLLEINSKLEIASISGVVGTSELLLNTNSTEGGITLGIVPSVEYKGFKFAIREENNSKFIVRGYKRHYAEAIDSNNVAVLKSDYSFTLDPDDLIEQLKLAIDKLKLKDSSSINVSGEEGDYSSDIEQAINGDTANGISSLINNTQQNQAIQAQQQQQILQQQITSTATQVALTTRPPLTAQQKQFYNRIYRDIDKPLYERQNAKAILDRNYI